MNKVFTPLIFAVTIIISAFILGNAWQRTHKQNETIKVTGMASRNFISDLIVWRGTFSKKSLSIKDAYSELKRDASLTKEYLIKKGVKESEMVFMAVNTMKDYRYSTNSGGQNTSVFDGYVLSQDIQIESNEVDKIEKISREVTELIDLGVEFTSQIPYYYSTKLADLKIEMLAQASVDGRLRAEKMAENAGGRLGGLRSASMGIFQITGQNSGEDYSWGGAFNITSKKKTASITVKLEYAVK
jgi:uncharacterized protein